MFLLAVHIKLGLKIIFKLNYLEMQTITSVTDYLLQRNLRNLLKKKRIIRMQEKLLLPILLHFAQKFAVLI